MYRLCVLAASLSIELDRGLCMRGLDRSRPLWDRQPPKAEPTPNPDGSTPAGSLDRGKGERTPSAGSSRDLRCAAEGGDELADLLDRYSPVDLDGVLGILHAA